MPATRNVDPDICKVRGRLGVAVREGDEKAAEQYRQELAELKFQIDIERAVDAYMAKIGPLTDAQVDSIATYLSGA